MLFFFKNFRVLAPGRHPVPFGVILMPDGAMRPLLVRTENSEGLLIAPGRCDLSGCDILVRNGPEA